MPVIDLNAEQKKKVRRIILFRPRPAKVHRKAVILYQLSRWDDVGKMAHRYRLKPEAIARVLDEYQSHGLDATIAITDPVTEHRMRLKEIEKRAPSREKFREILDRFPAPDRWLDEDEDWDL